jgi:FkbM family methyltransferase
MFNIYFISFRRFLLRELVPEFFWPEFVLMDGVKIAVRGMPYSFGIKRLLSANKYESEERQLIIQALKEGDVVVELGASIGIASRVIASRIGKTGRLVSVEALQTLVDSSNLWIDQFPMMKVVQGFAFPVYELSKSVSIDGFDDTSGSLGGVLQFSQGKESNNKSNDQVYDLKKIEAMYNITPNVLIVDIEGSERVLLEEGAYIPQNVKQIVMELHPEMYDDGLETQDAIIKKLEVEGFELKGIVENNYYFKRNI